MDQSTGGCLISREKAVKDVNSRVEFCFLVGAILNFDWSFFLDQSKSRIIPTKKQNRTHDLTSFTAFSRLSRHPPVITMSQDKSFGPDSNVDWTKSDRTF